MKNFTVLIALLILIPCMQLQTFGSTTTPQQPASWVKNSGGTISTLAELLWLSENQDVWNEIWILGSDIDASETSTWNNGEGFFPIGNINTPFSGTFDGNEYVISNLFINRPLVDNMGLFGVVTGTLSKISLTDADVTGGSYSGILAGDFYGAAALVEYCFATGSMTGELFAGGLIGYSNNGSTVSKSYTNVNLVCNTGPRGGLIGFNMGSTVQDCYSIGAVSVTGGPAGGLIGFNNYGTITNCYYDSETSGASLAVGQGDANGTTALTTVEFSDENNFPNWDFVNDWHIVSIEAISTSERPYFQWQTADAGLCDPVQNMLASVDGSTVLLSWDAPATGDVQVYNIYRNGELLDSITATVYSDQPISGSYDYCITATHTDGCESEEVCQSVTVEDICDPVQNFAGTIEVQSVVLTWEAPATGTVSEYIIYKDGYELTSTTALTYSDNPGIGTFNYCIEVNYESGCTSEQVCVTVEVSNNVISTLEELLWLSENPDAWDQNWILGADIDASETVNWNNGLGFSPIGDSPSGLGSRQEIPFTGSFDGQGFEISNIYINRPEEYYVGFFGQVTGGSISNLRISGIQVTGYTYVGGMIGYTTLNSTTTACFAGGDVSGNDIVGGLIGQIYQDVVTTNCHSSGNVSGNMWVGGLVGDNYSSANITDCYSDCDVTGVDYLGGLSGTNRWYSSINNSYSTGNVDGDASVSHYTGGLVGINNDAVINNCFSTASVSGFIRIGGLVGGNILSEIETGIYQCYATGQVSGTDLVGGVVGESYAWVTNCYFDIQTTGTANGIGNPDSGQEAFGLQSADFAYEYNFSDWDFSNTWTIYIDSEFSSELRPYLGWQFTELYTLNFTAIDGGSIEGAASQNVFPGSNSASVTATADEDYSFVEWQDANSNTYSTEQTLTILNVMEDASFTAIFEYNPIVYHTVTFTVTDGTNLLEGATITINETDLTTDANGVATIDLIDGDYSYNVTLDNYIPSSGNLTISGAAINEEITLVPDGVRNIETQSISIHPNPSNGIFYIEANGTYEVTIISVTGKIIHSAIASGKSTINISKEPEGIYFMQMKRDNKIESHKIIIR